MTMEDVIPGWAARILRTQRPGRFQNVQETLMGEQAHREWQSEAVVGVRIRVCKSCNESMSAEIEEPARAAIAPLLTHWRVARPLGSAAERAIARWITKIVLLAPLAGVPRALPLRQPDWGHLRTKQEPAPNVFIWLGAYTGQRPVDNLIQFANFNFGVPEDSTRVEQGVLSTLLVGHLVAQVLITPRVGGGLREAASVAFDAELGPFLVPIWPHADDPAWWPPERSLQEHGMARLIAGGEVDRRRQPR